MSSGHKVADHGGLGEADLDKVLRDPKIQKALGQRVKLDFSWDVPYLAGYSKDGKTIFIDRHLPKILKIGRKHLWVVPPLVRHERLEKILEDQRAMKYPAAHQLATLYEHRLVRNIFGDPHKYEVALRPYIKADEVERLLRVPKDLDRAPYLAKPIDEALLRRLDYAMNNPVQAGATQTKITTGAASGIHNRKPSPKSSREKI